MSQTTVLLFLVSVLFFPKCKAYAGQAKLETASNFTLPFFLNKFSTLATHNLLACWPLTNEHDGGRSLNNLAENSLRETLVALWLLAVGLRFLRTFSTIADHKQNRFSAIVRSFVWCAGHLKLRVYITVAVRQKY